MKASLTNINSLCEYVDTIVQMKNICIVIVVKDSIGVNLNDKIFCKLQNLGLKELVKENICENYGRKGYVAVINDGEVHTEYLGEYNQSVSEYIVIGEHHIILDSRPFNNGNSASIRVDDNRINYSANLRGINISIFDSGFNSCIDIVNFDTCTKELVCTHKSRLLYPIGNKISVEKTNERQLNLYNKLTETPLTIIGEDQEVNEFVTLYGNKIKRYNVVLLDSIFEEECCKIVEQAMLENNNVVFCCSEEKHIVSICQEEFFENRENILPRKLVETILDGKKVVVVIEFGYRELIEGILNTFPEWDLFYSVFVYSIRKDIGEKSDNYCELSTIAYYCNVIIYEPFFISEIDDGSNFLDYIPVDTVKLQLPAKFWLPSV